MAAVGACATSPRAVPIGAYPRGIAVSPKGNAAYVAVMGGSELVRVDLRRWTTSTIGVGAGPRAAELHPSDRYIFVSLNLRAHAPVAEAITKLRTADITTLQTIEACIVVDADRARVATARRPRGRGVATGSAPRGPPRDASPRSTSRRPTRVG